MRGRLGALGWVVGAAALGAVAGLVLRLRWGPALAALAMATAAIPLVHAWRQSRGTELRAAVAWAALALLLGLATQLQALMESPATGRPWAGHWAYLSTLATLAATITILNARRPGGGAWALLMGLLVLVFLLPWVEGSGLARRSGALARLRMDAPWSIFYGLLVLAGVTNYLPTRYGPAALGLLLSFGSMYAGLATTSRPAEDRAVCWLMAPLIASTSAWVAEGCRHRRPEGPPGLGRLWAWFRDHWGVVWSLRVQERFNRSAEALGWPIRLSWHGVESASGGEAPPEATPEAAEATLKGLLRRFADADRLDRAGGRPCDPGTVAR